MVEINADFCAAHAVVVVMECHTREIEAEFFAQFADKCGFVAFARLNLAAEFLLGGRSAMSSWPSRFSMIAATTAMVALIRRVCRGSL